ncbi:ParB-like protein [Devosia sp.]|uniref:ParB-like protein n=1 Tax=Devosia sp. TaxID=1871048 RepID=UPI003F7133D3
MPRSIEPLLHPFAIAALRPTQMTVGYREVARKRAEWRARTLADEPDFLGRHMIPVVLGPRGHPWLIDNHHLARALHEEGVAHVLVNIVADLSALERPAFRTFMDNRNWLHPFDAQGRRQPYGAIPKHIAELGDDPYRSLAGELRRAGGYAKDSMPYAEFLWADYLRRHIGAAALGRGFGAAVAAALQLAHTPQASYLLGWAGPEA